LSDDVKRAFLVGVKYVALVGSSGAHSCPCLRAAGTEAIEG
jgi:hypothetical protein